ncbi:MAG: regulatory protein RecX [Bacteroidota bacterium]
MDKKQALSKAMALCARQEYCESDIRGKLKTWGILEADSDSIIKELIKQKFIDDLRFTIAFLRDKIRFNQWGRIKIRYMLTARKIQGSIINQALDGIEEALYTETLRDLLQKKDKTLLRETDPRVRREKLIRFALGHGFEMDEILKILKTD